MDNSDSHIPAPPQPDNSQANAQPSAKQQQNNTKDSKIAPLQSNIIIVAGSDDDSRMTKCIAFIGAMALVLWVGTELIETHGVWRLLSLVVVIVSFLIVACYELAKLLKCKAAIFIFFVICFVSCVTIAIKNALTPAFSIIPRQEYIEMKTPRHFIICDVNGRVIRCPINVVLFAQFTNLRDKALAINSYQFEGFTTNNTWEIMPTIDIKLGHTVSFVGKSYGTNGFGIVLGPVKEGDAVNSNYGDDIFPEFFNGKIIVPGGVLSGIFFLEGPKHGYAGKIRCRIKDSTDEEFVELVSPQVTNYLKTTLPLGGGLLGIPTQEKIKDIPVVPWSEAFQD